MWIIKDNRAVNIEKATDAAIISADNEIVFYNGDVVLCSFEFEADELKQKFREIFDAINNNTKVLYID